MAICSAEVLVVVNLVDHHANAHLDTTTTPGLCGAGVPPAETTPSRQSETAEVGLDVHGEGLEIAESFVKERREDKEIHLQIAVYQHIS